LIGSGLGLAYEFGPPIVSDEDVAQAGTYILSAIPGTNTSASAVSCNIKGNISASGERIYHLPGQQYYSRTLVSVTKGERWFCSEVEAREAGWRRAKV
jgi:hypothetical protein